VFYAEGVEGPLTDIPCSSGPSGVKRDKLKLTQPHTPHLMTRRRNRPPVTKSSAELEEEELEKRQK